VVGTALLSGFAALLLLVGTQWLIPMLAARTGVEPILFWFLVGGLGVFTPLALIGVMLLIQEGALGRPGLWRERLWFRPMTGADWLWSLAGLVAVGILSSATVAVMTVLHGEVRLHPPFVTMEPLTPGRYWILAVWLPFWLVNILGEEFLWRGVVLPRQEVTFGRWAWLANGFAWLVFHIAFGPILMLVLWPILFILPWIVQRQRNAWIGVAIHGGLNGPGFVAVAFGLA
jgi:membrane protease YdiL (CAAX protease family)